MTTSKAKLIRPVFNKKMQSIDGIKFRDETISIIEIYHPRNCLIYYKVRSEPDPKGDFFWGLSKNYIDQFERDGTDFVVILLAGSSDKGFSFVKSEILQNRHTLEATGYFSSIDNQYKIINSCLGLLGRSQFDFTSFEELEELLKNYLEKKGAQSQ